MTDYIILPGKYQYKCRVCDIKISGHKGMIDHDNSDGHRNLKSTEKKEGEPEYIPTNDSEVFSPGWTHGRKVRYLAKLMKQMQEVVDSIANDIES